MSSKIVIKKPTATAVPKASSVVVPAKSDARLAQSPLSRAQKQVVVAAPKKVVMAAPTKMVAPKKTPIQKVVYVQEEDEDEDEEVEEQPMSRDEMLAQALTLLSQALGMKTGRGAKAIKFNKDGSMRQPRGPRENSEKQTAWMAFVKEVRAEQGVDENGKFLISHKDAMKLAKEMRAEEAGSDEAEEDAPVPAPKRVVAKLPKVVAAKKSPQQIREELAAKKKAEEAAAAASADEEEAEASVEVEEFEHNGQTYLKNSDNLCWLTDAEGNQTWAGVYLPDEDRIDAEVEEPTA